MIQESSALCEWLDQLYKEWRVESLIHGDIRWDNFSLFVSSAAGRKSGLRIVDWELACLGDPCWDVGTVFSEYMNLWLRSAPISGGTLPEQFLKFARYPLEKMQPAIRSFWNSYVRQMDPDTLQSEEWLLRSVKYSAARLVQTAFERVQEAVQVTGQAACLLQLSANILERPREASVQLFGIPLR
jgi:thiamine kinase-like enzyme